MCLDGGVVSYYDTGGDVKSGLDELELKQLAGLMKRGIPMEEALKAVGRPDFYQSQRQLFTGGGDLGWFGIALDFVPIIGDIKGGIEVLIELTKNPINWVTVGLLTAATAIGVIPGAGDAVAAGIKQVAKTATPQVIQELLAAIGERSLEKIQAVISKAKTGVATVASIVAEITQKITEAFGDDVAELLAADIADRAGDAVSAIAKEPSRQQEIIQKHIDELTAEAEARGYKVKHVDSNYNHNFANKTISIPGGPWSVSDYLIALEEFNHSLSLIHI